MIVATSQNGDLKPDLSFLGRNYLPMLVFISNLCCLEFDADCSSYPTVGDTLHHHLSFLVISALPMDQIPIPNLRHLSNTLCQAGQNIFPTWQEIKVLSTHPVSFPNISRLIRTTFKKPGNWYALCFWGKPWLALSDGPAFYAPEGSLELILEVLPASVWWESATRHILLFLTIIRQKRSNGIRAYTYIYIYI